MREKPQGEQVCTVCGMDPEKYQADAFALPPFTILNGRYLIGKALGAGGFGITYIAMDLALEHVVAIKEYFVRSVMYRANTNSTIVTVSQNSVTDQDVYRSGRHRFHEEAQIMAKLEDLPGIVRVQNLFEENNTSYIAMEYLSGQTLKSYVKSKGGRLSFKETMDCLTPLMASLQKLHERDIIHRDISPDNMMFNANGELKLLDFGGVKQLVSENGEQRSTIVQMKRGYSPLEQTMSGSRQGPWTDVYALAATIYYCLCGNAPTDAIERVSGIRILSPREAGSDIPAIAEEALMKGLALQIPDRFQSVTELITALNKAERMAKPEQVVTPVRKPETKAKPEPKSKPESPSKPKKSIVPAVVGAVALVAVVGAGAVVAFSPKIQNTLRHVPSEEAAYVVNDEVGYTNQKAELFSKMNESSEVLETLPVAEKLTVLDKSQSWVHVKTTSGKTGYISQADYNTRQPTSVHLPDEEGYRFTTWDGKDITLEDSVEQAFVYGKDRNQILVHYNDGRLSILDKDQKEVSQLDDHVGHVWSYHDGWLIYEKQDYLDEKEAALHDYAERYSAIHPEDPKSYEEVLADYQSWLSGDDGQYYTEDSGYLAYYEAYFYEDPACTKTLEASNAETGETITVENVRRFTMSGSYLFYADDDHVTLYNRETGEKTQAEIQGDRRSVVRLIDITNEGLGLWEEVTPSADRSGDRHDIFSIRNGQTESLCTYTDENTYDYIYGTQTLITEGGRVIYGWGSDWNQMLRAEEGKEATLLDLPGYVDQVYDFDGEQYAFLDENASIDALYVVCNLTDDYEADKVVAKVSGDQVTDACPNTTMKQVEIRDGKVVYIDANDTNLYWANFTGIRVKKLADQVEEIAFVSRNADSVYYWTTTRSNESWSQNGTLHVYRIDGDRVIDTVEDVSPWSYTYFGSTDGKTLLWIAGGEDYTKGDLYRWDYDGSKQKIDDNVYRYDTIYGSTESYADPDNFYYWKVTSGVFGSDDFAMTGMHYDGHSTEESGWTAHQLW